MEQCYRFNKSWSFTTMQHSLRCCKWIFCPFLPHLLARSCPLRSSRPIGESMSRLPQGQSRQQPNGASAQCSTRRRPAVSAQRTGNCVIGGSQLIPSQTCCPRTPHPGATTTCADICNTGWLVQSITHVEEIASSWGIVPSALRQGRPKDNDHGYVLLQNLETQGSGWNRLSHSTPHGPMLQKQQFAN